MKSAGENRDKAEIAKCRFCVQSFEYQLGAGNHPDSFARERGSLWPI